MGTCALGIHGRSASVGCVANRSDGPALEEEVPPWPLRLRMPPKVLDALVVAVVAVLYLGFLASQVVIAKGHVVTPRWHAHTIAAAACFPTVFALWWRRRYPLGVLAVASVATVVAQPFPDLFLIVALFGAAARVPARTAVAAWAFAAACRIVGGAVYGHGLRGSDVLSAIFMTASVAALGQYVGVRRAYYARLRERALLAKALASYLPTEVAAMIERSPGALSLQEELDATVLFSDIRGFTTFAERLAPREVAEVVGRHLAAMSEVVVAHGGTVDKFAGDAVMAVFGAPRPLPGHPAHAIRCAIQMQRRQSELNEEGWPFDLPPIGIGIGVNAGTVFAGTVGASRREYTVMGDAVNVAQRLQSVAKAGEILVSELALRHAPGIAAEPVEPMFLKGRRQPVSVFRVVVRPT
jgi:class 3 adenylate cyclase